MLLNCGAGEDSCGSLRLKRDQTSQSFFFHLFLDESGGEGGGRGDRDGEYL